MIRFLDGPAQGELSLRRAPIFLRAVVDRETGKIDALDQLSDMPAKTETIHVYQAVEGTLFNMRADIIICPPQASAAGEYRHRADVDGEQFRDAGIWQRWCIDHARVPVAP